MQTRESKPVRTGLVSFITLFSLFVASMAWSPAARADLIAYWNFDEASGTNVFDTAGNLTKTNDGFFATGAETPTRVTGRLGGAVGFTWQTANNPGSGRRVIVPYHTNLSMNGPITISYWYRMDAATPAGTFPGIMRLGSQSTLTGNNVGWGFFRTGNMVYKRGNNQPTLFGAMNVGQWYHLALTWNGNTNAGIINTTGYLNGVTVSFAAVNGWSNVTATTIFEMGRMDAFDQATLDDLALWSNEAVSPGKVRSIYTVPTFLFLNYNIADMRTLWGVFDGAGTSNAVVKGATWTYTTSLPGSTTQGDSYIFGGAMYVVLAPGAGVVAPLIALSGTFSPAGIGTIGTLAPTNDFVVTNANLIYDLNSSTTPGGAVNDLINVTGNLSIFNSTVSIDPVSPLGGTYRLANYSGTKTGSLVVSNTTRYALTLDETTANQINLNVSGTNGSVQWASTGSGNWDLSTTNWSNLVSLAADKFFQGDSVLFDDSGAFTTNIVVVTPVFPRSITINSSNRPYVFTGTEQIGGVSDGITKNGTNIVIISTPNTFVGDVRLNSGYLRLGNSGALGTTNGQTIVANGATLDLGGVAPGFESVTIQGAGVAGTGAVVNAGGAINNNGLRSRVVLVGDTTFGGSARWDIVSAQVTGGGFNITKKGNIEMYLNGNGDMGFGDVDVQSGFFTWGGNSTPGDPSKTYTVGSSAILNFFAHTVPFNKVLVLQSGATVQNGNGSATLAGPVILNGTANFNLGNPVAATNVISGAGPLVKLGAGTLTLGGVNTYTQRTTISAGRLALAAGGSIATSPRLEINNGTIFDVTQLGGGYTVAAGQTLVGGGTVHGSLVVPTNGTVLPGVENIAATLTVTNNLTLSGGTLTFDLATAITEGGGVNDLINIAGNLNLANVSSIIVNPLGLLAIGNVYTLMNYTGTLSGAAANLAVINNTRYTFALSTLVPGKVTLTVTGGAAGDLFWFGGSPGGPTSWDFTTPNWNDSLGMPATFFGGDKVTFDDFASTNVVDLIGNLTPASISVQNGDPTFNYLFQGSGKLSGNSTLTKLFDATATIANTGFNDYVGATTVEGGTLRVGTGGTFGNLGSGPITNNATLIFNRSDTITLANQISGTSGGTLIKSNANLMVLSAANSNYSGGIIAAGGTLRAGVSNALGNGTGGTVIQSGGTLDINAVNLADEQVTVGGTGVGGNGAIINASGTGQNNALRFVTLSGNTTVGGAGRWDIRAAPTAALSTGSNSYSLTKVGANQVSLVDVAVDPFLADININAGIFSAELGSGAGDPTKTVNIASGATLQFFNRTVVWNKNHVLAGGAIILNNSGDNAMDGAITLNGTATFNVGGAALTVRGPIGGTGAVTKATGAGSLWFGSDNTYTGVTTITTGPLYLGLGTNAGSVAGPIVNSGGLGIFRSDTYTFTNPYSGNANFQSRSPNGVIIGIPTMNIPGTMQVGYTNAGKLIIPASFVSGTWNNFFLGDSPNVPGEAIILGGAITVSSQMRVGHWPNNVSMVTMGGGTLTLTAIPAAQVNQGAVAEQNGVIYLGIDGVGILVQTGGVINAHGIVLDGRGNTAGDDTFILNGGRFNFGASGLKSGTSDGNTTYAIRLGGGVLGSSATWTSTLAMTLTGTNGNTTFDIPGTFSNVLTGPLTGPGGLTKIGTGTLLLTSNETYQGGTIVTQGTLFVRQNLGGGSNVVVTGGTLGGEGIISEPVIVGTGGTLAPGFSIGKLTVNNTVSLSGNTIMEVSKLGTLFTNDAVIANSILFGGKLTVVASGDALLPGDQFDLFEAGTSSGSFSSFALPTLPAGLAWDTSRVSVDGILSVIGAGPALQISLAGGTISLSWPNGFSGYSLQAQTNAPGVGITTNWITLTNITTNVISFPRDTISGSVFYRLLGP